MKCHLRESDKLLRSDVTWVASLSSHGASPDISRLTKPHRSFLEVFVALAVFLHGERVRPFEMLNSTTDAVVVSSSNTHTSCPGRDLSP